MHVYIILVFGKWLGLVGYIFFSPIVVDYFFKAKDFAI